MKIHNHKYREFLFKKNRKIMKTTQEEIDRAFK